MFIDEKEIAAKKSEDIRNKELVDKQLREEGISPLIANNPRYQSILSRISYMMMNKWVRKDFVVSVDGDGNVVLSQSSNGKNIMGMKYYIDKKDNCLKRVKVEFNSLGEESIKTISTYDSDGIETCLLLDQRIDDDDRYLTKTTRLESRPDIIKIERIEQLGKDQKRLPDVYQSRIFFAAMEDIEPEPIEVDPFNTCFFDLYGFPPTYREVSPLEVEVIQSGILLSLPQKDREDQFKVYRQTNATFYRTTIFEEGIADLLDVDSRMIDD